MVLCRWSREEWAYRAGLKDVIDEEDVTMVRST